MRQKMGSTKPSAEKVAQHARLLTFLDHHPLVRRIELPGIVVRASASTDRLGRSLTHLPAILKARGIAFR
jgi:hypothetical protein